MTRSERPSAAVHLDLGVPGCRGQAARVHTLPALGPVFVGHQVTVTVQHQPELSARVDAHELGVTDHHQHERGRGGFVREQDFCGELDVQGVVVGVCRIGHRTSSLVSHNYIQ